MDQESNDCTADGSGSFGLRPHEAHNWSAAWSVCVSRCLKCERCRYITVSLKESDCSWYAHCDMRRLHSAQGFRSLKVQSGELQRIPHLSLHAPPSNQDGAPPSCSIYIHDPGARFNSQPMALADQRWGDTDIAWHVAYWLHQTLRTYAHRVDNPANADVIFLAHYFLTDHPRNKPLDFGSPLLQWDTALREGGVEELFLHDRALLQRWETRPADFVVAPILLACMKARGFLHAARWIITEPFFGNSCGYRYHFDIVSPQVVSSPAWAPSAVDVSVPKPRFLTYVGRIGKAYIEPPMSMVRYRMWASLRWHPNVTFLATDYNEAVAPYFQDPLKPCKTCSYSCKRCLDPEIGLNPAVGVLPRETSKTAYRSWMTGSMFCLVRHRAIARGTTPCTL